MVKRAFRIGLFFLATNCFSATSAYKGQVVTAFQGNGSWAVNVSSISGSTLSAGNYIPARLTDGTGYIKTEEWQGLRYLGASINQDVHASTSNSTTSPLNSGATWTGNAESSLFVAGIQVNARMDSHGTLYVDQSNDGTNWDTSYSYVVSSGTGLARTVQATASFFRVRLKNDGATNATYTRVQTALCPIVEALPPSLTEYGNLSVGVKEAFYDATTESYGRITPMNRLVVAEPKRLVGVGFSSGPLDTSFWTSTNTVNATTTTTSGVLTMTSAALAQSTSTVYSVRIARYLSGTNNNARFIARTGDLGASGNRRLWGVATKDGREGYFFDLTGTVLGVTTRKDNVDNRVIEFNGQYGQSYPTLTNIHTYEIAWTNSKVMFMIDGKLLHVTKGQTAPLSQTQNFGIYLQNGNDITGTTSTTLEVRTSSIYRMGSAEDSPAYYHKAAGATTITLKSSPGTFKKMVMNGVGAANSNNCTLYDSTGAGGAVIAIFTMTTAMFGSWDYSLDFYNGITIVCEANTPDMTFVFE